MLLENKNAVIYGAGAIGAAVARTFAAEGARVFLAGRTRATLDAVAKEIHAAGGSAETAEVDALDENAVHAHADDVAARAGSLDVAFNLVGLQDVQGTPMADMALSDFERPIHVAVRSTFLVWRAAARHMRSQGAGVLLAFGGEGEPMREHYLGGFQIALHTVEAMRRQFATELGADGVRVVTLRTGGIPESIPADFAHKETITKELEAATLGGKTATLDDLGNVAAFVASDKARTMTAATANISCGAVVD